MEGEGRGSREIFKKKGAENAGNKTWQNEQNTSQVGEGDTRIICKSEDKRKASTVGNKPERDSFLHSLRL